MVESTESEAGAPPYALHKNGITVHVHALPGAQKSALAGTSAGRLRIKVAGRAQEGRANRELLEFMAAQLGVSKSSVSLSKGEKSREKSLFVQGDASDLLAKVEKLIDENK